MPLPTIADTFRVAFDGSTGTRTTANVMHFYAPGDDELAVAAAIDAHVSANMWNLTNDGFAFHQLVVTKLDGTPDGVVVPVDGTAAKWKGAGGTDYVPTMCALVKLATAGTGRSGRGRVYLPHMAEGNQAAGVVFETNRAACETAWQAFITAMAGVAVTMCVASYTEAAKHIVTSLRVEKNIASQRRRFKRSSL